jgi:glyoxylase-like metal-dependent hydrolase (beta-lactamase superfamily II)
MMEVKTFVVNPIQENTFVVSDETKEAVIIDCGALYPSEHQAIKRYLSNNELTLKHLLCTHGHLDHCFGNITIYEEFGLKPEVMADDEFLITKLDEQARNIFGFTLEDAIPPVGHYLTEGEVITFGNHQLKVIATPGHTPGSAVFYCEEEGVAFTGDTLFYMSVGRTDFERGSYSQLMESLEKLKQQLPPATKLYTGHGPSTSMETELRGNMYLR